MTGQTDLLEALKQVEENANDRWLTLATKLILELAATHTPFTTDDVWDALACYSTTTHEPRALGAIMRKLRFAKVIEPTGNYRKTRRVEAHQRPIAEWIGV